MNQKHGYMNCEGCRADGKTTRLLVRVGEKGGYSARCDECDVTDGAPKGTAKHARWSRNIELIAPPAPDKKQPSAPPPAPDKKQPSAPPAPAGFKMPGV